MAERMVLHVMPHSGGGGETYVDLLESMEGFRFRRVHLTEEGGRLEAIRGVPGARRAAADADLVHVHGDSAAILCARILRRRPGVITFHGLNLLRRSRGPLRALVETGLRRAIRFSRAGICVSSAEYEDATALAGRRLGERLVRIDNGVPEPGAPDPELRATTRRELGLTDDQVAVLYVGQLGPHKGVRDLLEALEIARAQGARLTGLIAGDGPLLDLLAAEPAGAQLLGQREDIDALLEAADVFVMPSRREGLSLAVLQAMRKGLAVVVSDGPGNPDAVGDSGMVFAYREPGAMATVQGKLTRAPALRGRL